MCVAAGKVRVESRAKMRSDLWGCGVLEGGGGRRVGEGGGWVVSSHGQHLGGWVAFSHAQDSVRCV